MNISVSQASGRVPVTVIKLDGQLDGQNFQELITKAQELHSAGARDFLLDLSDLTYISSAGLVALHSVALMARGRSFRTWKADGLPTVRWDVPARRASKSMSSCSTRGVKS